MAGIGVLRAGITQPHQQLQSWYRFRHSPAHLVLAGEPGLRASGIRWLAFSGSFVIFTAALWVVNTDHDRVRFRICSDRIS